MSPEQLIATLRTRGRQPAAELAARLAISRPTLMRNVRAASDEVVARGKARRTAYAARRGLRGRSDPLPMYRVDERGASLQIGLVQLTHPSGCVLDLLAPLAWPVADADMADGWFDGLPYPLYDARPQGFLGRHFAREHAAILQVDDDPERWSDDDVLQALSLFGRDSPGDLILGEPAYRRWLDAVQSPATPIADDELERRYVDLAESALLHGMGDSSAGGHFPKFTATRRRRQTVRSPRARGAAATPIDHVIVKFSGNDDSGGTRRWSDLLVCEHLAANVQRDRLDIAAAESTVHQAGGRTFLEVVRFDRHGLHGRSGLCSWSTLNTALVGADPGAWPETTSRLVRMGRLDPDSYGAIGRQWHFGRLIANTDMHEGNLSFLPPRAGEATMRVAPAYDMLPMLYAPARGVELVPRPYAPQLPLPAQRGAWNPAARAALVFWQAASKDERISRAFRKVCKDNAGTLRRLIDLAAAS